ncbi:MAG: MAPEG family protein [Bdellovibrionaceae bacterium]|nr:MAPEG family protein [Pseudobdellovibrionaceae bacterium]
MVSTELNMLTFSIFLGIVQLLLATQLETRARGVAWNLSNRDVPPEPLPGLAGRVKRAHQNFLETFPFFVAAVACVQMSGLGDNLSAFGAILYFTARLIYFPVYAMGIMVVRSLAWAASLLGIVLIAASMFINF